MIDVSKCEFEEKCKTPSEDVYYFIYPKTWDEVEFDSEEDYGEVVSMCILISFPNNEDSTPIVMMSPTVKEEDNTLVDVEWRDMYEGRNYTVDMIKKLIEKAERK